MLSLLSNIDLQMRDVAVRPPQKPKAALAVACRDIEPTVFDPASVFLSTLIKSETRPASFFQKRPVPVVKETYSAGFPHTQPACF